GRRSWPGGCGGCCWVCGRLRRVGCGRFGAFPEVNCKSIVRLRLCFSCGRAACCANKCRRYFQSFNARGGPLVWPFAQTSCAPTGSVGRAAQKLIAGFVVEDAFSY